MPAHPYRRIRALLLVPLVGGCYASAPADPAGLAPGDDLRVRLSFEARVRLNETADELRGELLGMSNDSLTIGTRLRIPAHAGNPVSMLRRSLTLARDEVVQITVPRFDGGRTAAVVGGALVLAAVLVLDLFDIRGEGGSPPREPPDTGSPFGGRW